MKPCLFCAEEIQDAAKLCHHCGKEQRRKVSTASGCLIVVGLVVALGWVIGAIVSRDSPPSETTAPAKPAVTVDRSPAMQARRERLIAKLRRARVIREITDPGNLPRVWVGEEFYALDFDQKQTFITVVYAYYFDGSRFSDSVLVFDSQTGKKVGSYNPHLGGLKMK